MKQRAPKPRKPRKRDMLEQTIRVAAPSITDRVVVEKEDILETKDGAAWRVLLVSWEWRDENGEPAAPLGLQRGRVEIRVKDPGKPLTHRQLVDRLRELLVEHGGWKAV